MVGSIGCPDRYLDNSTCRRCHERSARMKYHLEFYEDAANEHRWRIRHENGNVIADSGEGYKNLTDCQTALLNLERAFQQSRVFGLPG
jgi:uncharacterized protein YegP (UPF0339 family)